MFSKLPGMVNKFCQAVQTPASRSVIETPKLGKGETRYKTIRGSRNKAACNTLLGASSNPMEFCDHSISSFDATLPANEETPSTVVPKSTSPVAFPPVHSCNIGPNARRP